MNHSVSDNVDSGLIPGMLESCWSQIQDCRHRIAEEIEIKSEGLTNASAKQALATSQFFRGAASYDEALQHSCILAVANPLARQAVDRKITPGEIAKAVHLGLCTMSRHGVNHQTLLRLFLVPALLAMFGIVGAILISAFILEPFETLYAEFGIQLPAITRGLMFAGYVIRTYTISILVVVFGIPPLVWLLNQIGQRRRDPGMGLLDVILSRRRPAVARWLLHVSLLIESGLAKSEAIAAASSLSGKSLLQGRAKRQAKRAEDGMTEGHGNFLGGIEFKLADTALEMPVSRGQVTMLQQVATWYRDTSASIIEWLVQLLVPLMIAAIVIGSFITIVSLLMPLFAIISGLTGGKAGGVM